MGCGGSTTKLTIEHAVTEVSSNPARGLPCLLSSINEQQKITGDVGKSMPNVLKIVATTLKSLSVENDKSIITACRVITESAQYYRDGNAELATTDDSPAQCVKRLTALLAKVQSKAFKSKSDTLCDDDAASKEANCIALAVMALFNIESHTLPAKEQFMANGGVRASTALVRANSGISNEAKASVLQMLAAFVDNFPASVSVIISAAAVPSVRTSVKDATHNKSSKDVQLDGCNVLEACVEWNNDVSEDSPKIKIWRR